MLNRTIEPEFYPVRAFKLIQPEEMAFENGVKTFVFRSDAQDMVRIEWIFENRYEDGDDSLIHSCLSSMIMEGTRQFSHTEIADIVDFHGAYLLPEFNNDYSTLTLYTLNKHLPNLLPLVKSLLSDADFPEKELNTYLRNRKQKLEIALQKNEVLARRYFNRALFGDTRYGKPAEPDSFERVNVEALHKLYGQQFVAANCTLILSGNVTDGILTSVRDLFGGQWKSDEQAGGQAAWSPLAGGGQLLPVFPDTSGSTHVEYREKALQSALRLGNRSIQRKHPDFPGMQFVNALLGGYFGSRLMTNIREDKGYTYGIGSGLVSLRHGAYLTIATEVGVEVSQSALTEIEREIGILKTETVPSHEIETVRNYMMGSLLGSLENIFSHADQFKQVHFSGLGLDYYDRYQETILQMDAVAVQVLANRYLDFDKMEKIVVGKLL